MRLVEARLAALDSERRRTIELAWTIAALSRSKRLPPLKKLLRRRRRRSVRQTWEEQLSVARLLNAAFGGDVLKASETHG